MSDLILWDWISWRRTDSYKSLITGEYFTEEAHSRDCGASVVPIVSHSATYVLSCSLKLYNREVKKTNSMQ